MATHTISTSIIIQASVQKVWTILTDTQAYPQWNPFIRTIEGNLNEGNKIKVNAGENTFRPTILEAKRYHTLKWKGSLIFKGIFDGTHEFKLTPLNDHKCRFDHSEFFEGLLVGLLKNKLINEVEPGFIAMNKALKERAENKKTDSF